MNSIPLPKLWTVVTGWVYECVGYRGRKHYFPYALHELPLGLGEEVTPWTKKGLDGPLTLEGIAELVGSGISKITVVDVPLIFDGEYYYRARSLKVAERNVREHNDAERHRFEYWKRKENDDSWNKDVRYKETNFEKLGVTKGWFCRLSDDRWREVEKAYDTALMCATLRGKSEYTTAYLVRQVRPIPPIYGTIVYLDGTVRDA